MFAELCAKTCFSFLEGASQPREVIARATEIGLPSIAIADRDGLYGIARAFDAEKQLRKANLPASRLVVGADMTLEGANATLVLLVATAEGYANLCQLITDAHRGREKGESALSLDRLSFRHRGLVALLPSPYSEGLVEATRAVFGDRVFLAAHRHFVADDRRRDREAKRLSKRFDVPIVATGRPLYHVPERRPAADVLACIRMGVTIDEAGARIAPNAEAFVRSEAEIRKVFRDEPAWIDRTGEIAEACRFSMAELKYRFPCEAKRPGETPDQTLARLVEEKLPWRYPHGVPASVRAQLDKELALIAKLAVAPYFLSVHDIVELARERGILCQGRGSAANSAVCFVLGVTSVDPARSSLLFERFLSAERNEPPDIDVDFEHERREEVIQEIYRRYGRDRAAMVSEIISYRGKSAIREVGKAMGLAEEQVDRMSGLLLYGDSTADVAKRIAEVGLDPADSRIQQTLSIATEIQGFPRHLSIHTGGFVLSAEPLIEVAPIEPARMEARTVVQWDKDDLDTLGFFKVDVLALGMLTAIRKCLELVAPSGGMTQEGAKARRSEGVGDGDNSTLRAFVPSCENPTAPFDAIGALAGIPPEEPAVYDAFCRADTVGVFQIESRAQMAMLPNLRPRRFYDLVIEVAIVRPGPIQGGMVHPYLRRRSGQEPITSPHPSLEPILSRTLGVPLFQEQVMQIAIVGAGYTGGEADELRRDMAAWRKDGRLARHEKKLLDGFAKNGIAPEFGEALYRQIQGFGEYGFPESHAASFALLVYASGWLKVHFPAAFACALLDSQPMGFYSASSIVQDAQRHGVEVRPVAIDRSDWDCTLEWDGSKSAPALGREQPALRLGFRQLKGFSQKTALVVEAARRAGGPFVDVDDLARRTRLSKRETEILAEAGALEPLVAGRREALWKARAPRVEGLFSGVPIAEPKPVLASLSAAEQLVLDYEHTGLSVGDHPMRHIRKRLPKHVRKSAELVEIAHGSRVAVAGIVQSRQRPGTASGVVFMTLEDETGTCNVIVWAQVFEKYRFDAVHAKVVLIRGELQKQATPGVRDASVVIHVVAREIVRIGADVRTASRDFH